METEKEKEMKLGVWLRRKIERWWAEMQELVTRTIGKMVLRQSFEEEREKGQKEDEGLGE